MAITVPRLAGYPAVSKKSGMAEIIPCLLEPELTDVQFVIKKILKHLNLWELKNRKDLLPMPSRGLNPRHSCLCVARRNATNLLHLPPMIISSIRFILWIPICKKRRKMKRQSMPEYAKLTAIS